MRPDHQRQAFTFSLQSLRQRQYGGTSVVRGLRPIAFQDTHVRRKAHVLLSQPGHDKAASPDSPSPEYRRHRPRFAAHPQGRPEMNRHGSHRAVGVALQVVSSGADLRICSARHQNLGRHPPLVSQEEMPSAGEDGLHGATKCSNKPHRSRSTGTPVHPRSAAKQVDDPPVGSFWPMRSMRPMRCSILLGFQGRS